MLKKAKADELFLEILCSILSNGLTEDMIVPGSRCGNTSFKNYCRLSVQPEIGLLYARELPDGENDSTQSIDIIRQRLATEESNFTKFQRLGARVPSRYAVCGSIIFDFCDRSGNPSSLASGMFVQHIDYIRLFKISYEARMLGDAIRRLGGSQQSKAESEYEKIISAAAQACPRDLQVLLTESGDIYVIDIEQLGEGRTISDLY